MRPLYTQDLANALTELLSGLEFLVERGVDTRPISAVVLELITTICMLDTDRWGGEQI